MMCAHKEGSLIELGLDTTDPNLFCFSSMAQDLDLFKKNFTQEEGRFFFDKRPMLFFPTNPFTPLGDSACLHLPYILFSINTFLLGARSCECEVIDSLLLS